MTFFVYFIVLLITAGSVIFGADWLQAPMTAMPASKYELHAAKPPPPPPVQQAEVKKDEIKTEAKKPDVKPAASAAPAEVKAAAVASPAPAETPAAPPSAAILADEPSPPVAAVEAPKCDVAACERAYRTFTVSDCTYQPSGDGPRRLCTKGTPPVAASLAKPEARAQASCNVAACSDAYISFNASDCTYQPSDGPRRLCTK